MKVKRKLSVFGIGEDETSKYWLTVLNDVLIFAIGGLNGFSEAISAVQRCKGVSFIV